MRAFLFDFNGVIVDDEPLHCLAWQRAVAAQGLTLRESIYFDHYLGLDDRGIIQRFLADEGELAPPDRVRVLIEEKAVIYADLAVTSLKAVPGSIEFIREAAARFPLAVASGALGPEIRYALERFGLEGCFSAVVSAEEVSVGKPSPEGYETAIRRLGSVAPGLRAESCLVIEDAPHGIRAAHAAGAKCVALTTTQPAYELGIADLVLPSLEGQDPARLLERLLGAG